MGNNRIHPKHHTWIGHNGKKPSVNAKCVTCGIVRKTETISGNTIQTFTLETGELLPSNPGCKKNY